MKESISYELFTQLDIRVAKVTKAEVLEESDKLIRLEVDLGEELGQKQILAGLKNSHTSEDLIGRHIIVLANLEPRKMMGMESQGMLLAADSESGPILLVPEGDAEAGASIK